MRFDGRAFDEIRSVRLTPGFSKYAEGSCLVEMGNTVVLCNASVEEKLPPHVTSGGWITAEYSMLPRANRQRSSRDISKLKLNGRSAEIQRLIGRSLRSAVDLNAMEGISVIVDCDVLQGDGGTRTASVTGGFVALMMALRKLVAAGRLPDMPVDTFVAAISAGIVDNEPLLDLCYQEDSRAMVDLNCVMTREGGIIELQGTGEQRPFSLQEQQTLVSLCHKGILELTEKQREVLGEL